MVNILDKHHFYLVGIKGVAMTALAGCLVDAGKSVTGSDVVEDFVTAQQLKQLQIQIDEGFAYPLPKNIDVVIHTGAHGGTTNPQVVAAKAAGIYTMMPMEALAVFFNHKQGIAVSGVGGKSTTSAMVAWILEKNGLQPSFAIGVGQILGWQRTGCWRPDSQLFVAEADEYAADPVAVQRGEPLVPRFAALEPKTIVCTNLKFDHPDVYKDFDHTQQVYTAFFEKLSAHGNLIVNADDAPLLHLAETVRAKTQCQLVTFGESVHADLRLISYSAEKGFTEAKFEYADQEYTLKLHIPGKFNIMNAAAAAAAASPHGVSISDAFFALASFQSTKRRVEFVATKNGVQYYDDYAHHPSEVAQVIHAFREWFPAQKLVIAFQSHTFSRTKTLFNEFVDAFAEASEVVMIDIFASAREAKDDSVSSDLLCEAIRHKYPLLPAQNFHTLPKLAEYCHATLQPGDVCLTVGAGDIYNLHQAL